MFVKNYVTLFDLNCIMEKELTKAEEQIMQVMWKIQKGFVNDIIEELPEPKPAYNTVSTIVRILEKKGFISHNAFGRTFQYFPIIEKNDYTKSYFNNFIQNYFNNSYKSLASFFAKENNLSIKELEEIKSLMEEEIQKQKR